MHTADAEGDDRSAAADPADLERTPSAGPSAAAAGTAPACRPAPGEGPRVRRAKHVKFLATLAKTDRSLPPGPDEVVAPAADRDLLLVPAPPPRRLLAAAIDAVVVFAAGAFGALLLTMLVWGALLNTDFDGPRSAEALGEWLLLGNWLALALLYTSVGAFGRPTPGQKALGLRLVLPDPPAGDAPNGDGPSDAPSGAVPHAAAPTWRFRLRWLLATLPLVVMTLVCAAAAARTEVQGYEAFEVVGWSPDARLAALALTLLPYWPAGLLWAWAGDGQTFWDRLSRVELRHAVPLPIQDQRRGFDVVPRQAAP